MLRSVSFHNFKALENFSVSLRTTNVLVGPNNAGKSTVLDGFRALAAAIRYARRYRAQPVRGPTGQRVFGFNIPAGTIPISTVNIHSHYREVETQVAFTLENGRRLTLFFDEDATCTLCLDAEIGSFSTTSQFARAYPVDIAVVPTLGPFEEDEELLTDDGYVQRWAGTRRGHRLFRNVWRRRPPEEFETFKRLVEETWPGMSIEPPEIIGYVPAQLKMFCKEERIDREIYWAGFGFQVWLQFLTHMISAQEHSSIVIDEPDIYLHPDLQRRLFNLVRSRAGQSILATHSVEIINEADPDDVVVVDKHRRRGRRVTDVAGMQHAIDSLGSTQNIHLTKLSQGRRVLFVEGTDFTLLRRFARRLRLHRLAEGTTITVIPIGGFGQWRKIEDAAWTFAQILRTDVSLAALFDHDFRCDEEVEIFLNELRKTVPLSFVLERKELENYMLNMSAISRAIRSRLEGNQPIEFDVDEYVAQLFETITSECKTHVRVQCDAHRLRFFAGSSEDQSTLLKRSSEWLDEQWTSIEGRVRVVPGKSLLTAMNRHLQDDLNTSLTHAMIINNMSISDIPKNLRVVLQRLEEFAMAE